MNEKIAWFLIWSAALALVLVALSACTLEYDAPTNTATPTSTTVVEIQTVMVTQIVTVEVTVIPTGYMLPFESGKPIEKKGE